MVTKKAFENQQAFKRFVDSQPPNKSAKRIIEDYRKQGGRIDHNFAYSYVTQATDEVTWLEYVILYSSSPRVEIKNKEVYDKVLSKKEIYKVSRDYVQYASLTGAISVSLVWKRAKQRTTNLLFAPIGQPITVYEKF